jgi:diguanylate cyclase (GGDEF)-like protein
VAVADIARATLRTTDVPARFGDDVFSVILPMTSKTEAFAVAEKLRLLLSEAAIRVRTADRADATVGIRVSIGVASVGEGMASAGDVIVAAERALDLAKSGGGDQVRLAAG